MIDRGQLRCLLSIDRRLSRDDTTAADRNGARDSGDAGPTVLGHELIVLSGYDDARLSADERRLWERNGSPASSPYRWSSTAGWSASSTSTTSALAASPTTSTSRAASASSSPVRSTTCFSSSGLPSPISSWECSPSRAWSSAPRSTSPRSCTPCRRGCASRLPRRAVTSLIEGERLVGLVSTDGATIDDAFPGSAYDLADFAIARRAVDLGQPVIVTDISTIHASPRSNGPRISGGATPVSSSFPSSTVARRSASRRSSISSMPTSPTPTSSAASRRSPRRRSERPRPRGPR